MRESLFIVFILLVILIAVNLTSICINWYLIKADVEDIPDRDVKINLLHSLKPLHKVFFRRVVYHQDSDYFSCEKDYKTFITYMNIHNIKYQVHSYHRYESNLEYDEIIPKRELETKMSDS